ncbi:MAG: DUF6385 domain-containing protein [Bacillota bacterium]
MNCQNEIYNSNFIYGKAPDYSFPDGWLEVGGDKDTKWVWNKAPSGEGQVKIVNPHNIKAGIRQLQSVYVPIGEKQRWLLKVFLTADTPGRLAYIRINYRNPAGFPLGSAEFYHKINPDKTEYQDVMITPCGASAALVEVGLEEAGTLYINGVFCWRLYPIKNIRVDEKGRIFVKNVETIQEIVKPVRVKLDAPIQANIKASIDADIRNLSYQRDTVRIYGSQSGAPLKTNPDGQAQVEIAGNSFTSVTQAVTTGDSLNRTASYNVSKLKVYSFAVLNTGAKPAIVKIYLSPDGINWIADGPELTQAPGKMEVLVAKYFLHYAAVGYRSAAAGEPTTLTVWFQAQC